MKLRLLRARLFYSIIVTCVLSASPGTGRGEVQTAARIKGEIDDTQVYRLVGNTKPMLALAHDQGEVDSALALPFVTLRFAMSPQQSEDLQQLLRQQQARGSAEYHKFLTPEEYGARFGANPDDIKKTADWLERQGFSNIQFSRSRTFITFAGTAGQAEAAFHTSIHRYSLNGETHYANANDPMLPKALAGTVQSIRGLHDFHKRPLGITKARPRNTTNGQHFLAPNDLATIYDINPLYQTGFDGTGVNIVVVGQSDILMSDISAFRSAAGLPANNPTVITVGPDPGRLTNTGDEAESDLDLEWSGGIAKGAHIIFVEAQSVDDAVTNAIDNMRAPILSTSYGLCEQDIGSAATMMEVTEYQQANSQGMTVLAAAGDDGAADCDTTYPATNGPAVDEPASLAEVTGVGGTTFNEGSGTYWNSSNNSLGGSATGYIPEVVWNDTNQANGLLGTGGGVSIYETKPSWQTGVGVPADGHRDVPDIALAADPNHDGYLICGDGSCTNGFVNSSGAPNVIGGTSCGAPSFAGIMALVVEALGMQGNINTNLYSLAANASFVFHDVTQGNNVVACKAGSTGCTNGSYGFSAGVGYDQTTGWGSVDAYQLLNAWNSNDVPVGVSSGPLRYVAITPCRILDTRNAEDTFGGPELAGNATRAFPIPQSACNIPPTASAYALNVTVVPDTELGYLTIWPMGQGMPLVSTLNSDGRVKANAAIVPAGVNGAVSVYVSNPTHLVMDIDGYFVSGTGASDLEFYPLAPCRIADTRQPAGPLGGPSLSAGQTRAFPIAGNCSVPSTAAAYSLNFTVVPQGALSYLSAWPVGQMQPSTSVLNAATGSITANAAIITAGNNGEINTYATNETDVVIDINGYFAAAGSNGYSFYTLTPCRVIDSRNPAGSSPFSGEMNVPVTTSGCDSPSSAQAYVLNATVVPSGVLGYLTLWPNGETQPLVSTLNAGLNTITSNMAIVPSTNGIIDAFASSATYLILDISGYFAP